MSTQSVQRDMQKRKKQLGMSWSKANYILHRDVLFHFTQVMGIQCFHCGKPLTRKTFSLEHKVPWLHAENAKELFFDMENITFSHIKCNVAAKRQTHKKYFSELEKQEARKRWQREWRIRHSAQYKKQRRAKYLRNGT